MCTNNIGFVAEIKELVFGENPPLSMNIVPVGFRRIHGRSVLLLQHPCCFMQWDISELFHSV